MASSCSDQGDRCLTGALNPPDSQKRPSKYAYFFPDDHPSLFVSFLGAGRQGAAILVRSVVDGNLYVRKRKRESSAMHAPDNETRNALPHANIPQLISQSRLPCPPPRLERSRRISTVRRCSINPPTADLWSYANGGDLEDLVGAYKKMSTPLPPSIIFQLMYQLLHVTTHIHNHDIAHGDILPPNIFVHWPSPPDHTEPTFSTATPSSSPLPLAVPATAATPQFLLGDFGVSFSLPPNAEARRFHRVLDTSQAIYGDITAIAGVVAYAMTLARYGGTSRVPSLKREFRNWYTSYGGDGNEAGKWLVICFDNLARLTGVLRRYEVARERDGEMFATVVGALVKDLETGMELCLKEVVDEKEDVFAKVRPRVLEKDRKVATLWSKDLLLAMECRPPGPWCVAQVDGLTGQLKRVHRGTKYCVNEAMVTRTRDGKEMEDAEVRRDGDITCG